MPCLHSLQLLLLLLSLVFVPSMQLVASIRSSQRRLLTVMAAAVPPTSGDEWYKKGLSFSCTMCGNCCSGTSGTVSFTEDEAVSMANKLDVPLPDFYSTYTRKRGKGQTARIELKEVRAPDGKGWDCVFLDRATMPVSAHGGHTRERNI